MNITSIKFKLIVGGLTIVLLPLIIVGYLSYQKSHQALASMGMNQAENTAADLAARTHSILAAEMQQAATVASGHDVVDLAKSVLENGIDGSDAIKQRVFASLKSQLASMDPHYQGIMLTDANGLIYTGVIENGNEYKGIDIGGLEFFKRVKQTGAPVISEMSRSKATGGLVVSADAPIKDSDGRFLGLAGIVIKADHFIELISKRQIGKTGYGYMINSKGITLAHPNEENQLKLNLATIQGMESIARKMMAGDKGVESYAYKGVDKISGFAPVGINGWSIGATQDAEEFLKSSTQIRNANIIVAVAAGLIAGVLILYVSVSIIKPINNAVVGLKDIAQGEGDLTKRLEITSRDEVGELSKWFNAFLDQLQQLIGHIVENVHSVESASAELSAISTQMSTGAGDTSQRANTVATAAEEMSANLNNVAAAMEQSSTNATMVASSAEEMTSTINEIAQNAEKARAVSDQAVSKANDTHKQMSELGKAADAIGKVIETITDISEQVNLLALNATIEAARAGEAGKGFAVVANEIKDLAKQTAEATLDIKQKIENIQTNTGGSVNAITEIGQVISGVNEIVATIATAVEEQSAATKEIANNISQASQGIQEVNENVNQSSAVAADITKTISEVNNAAGEMSSSSEQVKFSAEDLQKMAANLNQLVGRFKNIALSRWQKKPIPGAVSGPRPAPKERQHERSVSAKDLPPRQHPSKPAGRHRPFEQPDDPGRRTGSRQESAAAGHRGQGSARPRNHRPADRHGHIRIAGTDHAHPHADRGLYLRQIGGSGTRRITIHRQAHRPSG